MGRPNLPLPHRLSLLNQCQMAFRFVSLLWILPLDPILQAASNISHLIQVTV